MKSSEPPWLTAIIQPPNPLDAAAGRVVAR
jgi:hypothetical protein